jgi:addiction module HigA family antidote
MIKEVDKMTERIEPIHPGEVLQEDFLTPMNISAYKLAKETYIDQTRISEIIRGKRSITVDTALRFSKFFGTSPEFWINIQNQFDMENKKEELASELIKIHTFQFNDSQILQIV